MKFRTLRDVRVCDKVVLLRADLNVPEENRRVTDTTRIDRLKPTIDYLVGQGAKIVILSHFGRPEGKPDPVFSLDFLVPVLVQQWGKDVLFEKDCIGDDVKRRVAGLKSGEVLLLENVRFHKGEKKGDADFVHALSQLGEIYVNDAFSVSHRAEGSITGIPKYLPAVAGLLMEEELEALTSALIAPERPVAAIVGGSKISTKIGILENLVEKMDYLILGGGMANTFLYAKGYGLGKSLCEMDMKETALAILDTAKKSGCEIVLPVDVVAAAEFKENAAHMVVAVDAVSADQMALDIGPESIKAICSVVEICKTVVWNGPLGVFEMKPFDHGTSAVAKFVAQRTKQGTCRSVGGGGDTVSALENAGVGEKFSYISTAGGAFLEWLEGKSLPGIEALYQDCE